MLFYLLIKLHSLLFQLTMTEGSEDARYDKDLDMEEEQKM